MPNSNVFKKFLPKILVLLLWFSLGLPSQAETIQPYLNQVQERFSEFSLDNGIKFIILVNHQAPVISFVTYANVGGVDEPEGKTGVAHFLEHLAFKGTTKIGTTDYSAEKEILTHLDEVYQEIKQAQTSNNQAKLKQLNTQWEKLEQQALSYVKQNEFGQIVETEGGTGLNAVTSADYTAYFYNFPANKLELWMSLESERFLEPVFREFYTEKNVILEERRLRTDNSPIGQMIEAFLDEAFTLHPYKRPVIGYNQDIRNLTRSDVEEFFQTYYTPNNLTIAIVGDVDPEEVEQLAQIYFSRYLLKPEPPQLEIVEPPQSVTREVNLTLSSQPWYLEGYHRPSLRDKDHVVYEVITGLLSGGRTSRLYQSLVEKQQVALAAQSFNGFPGEKYPNLILFYALSAPGHSLAEVETAMRREIERFYLEPVTETELEKVKTNLKADLLRSLDSNSGMARLLVEYEVKTGSWQNLFTDLDKLTQVTPADVQRVAKATFTPENRTIGRILSDN
ncbi:pitrilysin family protein [Gloeocapsa sp. PCC 73106]|uniref:M16 family metallopeptidase n=1 Tax=Gloeocapsa sp. PCC 73106 TaxID=102232 RepID=UPI0002ABBBC4|nr:pitrilysin family protein [Gloeocapsa sp. PCC 73106]ELR97751.1 putative Zn-dependent peptidase [Gloeocapsa sp. PCC 73106]